MTTKLGEKPLFAVVTPVYNGARFIETALKAVSRQTYRPLVHVILDNASTDETPDIISRYAGGGAPLLISRNRATLPQLENWNAAVRLIPPETAFFKILCADDSMAPDAVERMMALAARAPGVSLIGGMERVNGVLRPSRLPPHIEIFDAVNMLARLLDDEARVSYPHVAYAARFARDRAAFFSGGLVGFDVEAVMRVLAQGGTMGFVHAPIFETLHHDASVTATVVQRSQSFAWENLVMAERFGPAALNNAQFRRVRRREFQVLLRRMLLWSVANRPLFRRDLQRLRERGITPSLFDYARAVIGWPAHVLERRRELARTPEPWPADAVVPHLQELSPG